MRSIRHILVILLSLALVLPAWAGLPAPSGQPHCQGMGDSAPAMAHHHIHSGKMGHTSTCCLGDHCEHSCVSPVALPVALLPPALPVATPQRIAFIPPFILSAMPTGVWHPPRRS